MTRRTLVAAAPAVLLAGCGAGADEDVPEPLTRRITSIQGDVELLTGALARERAEAALYARLGNERFAAIEREHASRIVDALKDLKAVPPEEDAPAARGDAVDREAESVAFWIDVLPKLYDPQIRSMAAGILAAEAEQLALLRSQKGQNPAPDPFVYGWTSPAAG